MNKSFTLIELLIIITIIAILVTTIIMITTPGERLAQARDVVRERHLRVIESALYIYQYDNLEFPFDISNELREICNTNNVDSSECGELVDLSNLGMVIPIDPQRGVTEKGTGYAVAVIEDRLLIDSLKAETKSIDIGINGLIGWWTFDGHVLDKSGYGNHGNLVGSPEFVDGRIDDAVRFYTNSDYITIPHDEKLSKEIFGTSEIFTLTGWVYVFEYENWACIISKSFGANWSNTTAGLWVSGNGLTAVVGANVSGNPSGSYKLVHYVNPEIEKWYHVVGVADGEKLHLYVNGNHEGDISISMNHDRSENTEPIIIGRRSTGNNPSLKGIIDDVRIYNRALSEQEIQSLYSRTKHNYFVKEE